MNYIAKKNLKHGAYYYGTCRNAQIARWNEYDNLFYHWRNKFGNRFIETINHPDDEDHYDVFEPWEEIADDYIPFKK